MTLPATMNDLKAQLDRARNFSQAASSSSVYLKMSKDGRWTYGSDELEIEEGSLWAINPQSFQTGFAAFDSNFNRLGEEMRNLSEPPVTQADLPQVNGRWLPQIGFQVRCMEGKDEGLQAVYTGRSQGGIQACTKLIDEVYKRIENGDTNCVPMCELNVESYKHNKYGKIYTPVFDIVDWTSLDGLSEEPEEIEETPPEPPRRERRRRA